MSNESEKGTSASCLCDASDIIVLPCSGASNNGQNSNEVALRLREAGKGRVYCTAGIGGHVKGMVEGARTAKLIVAIDGCAVGCVKKCLEGEKLEAGVYVVLADELKIPKDMNRPKDEDIRNAYEHIAAKVDAALKTA